MKKFLIPLFFVLMLACVFSIKLEASNAFGSAVNPFFALHSDNQYAKIFFLTPNNWVAVNGFNTRIKRIKTVEIGIEYYNPFCVPPNFLLEVSYKVKGNTGTTHYFHPEPCKERIYYYDITDDVPVGSKWTWRKIKNLTAKVKAKILFNSFSSNNPENLFFLPVKIDQIFLRINKHCREYKRIPGKNLMVCEEKIGETI